MHPYPSIETVFTRDAQTKRLDFGLIREPEVDLIKEWTVSEKIDGTNIRVIVTATGIEIKGRTDKADLPKGLAAAIERIFPSHETIIRYFQERKPSGSLPEDWCVTFYGEGYGAGIQKAGGRYSLVKTFRCFDLKYGDKHWADDMTMRMVCAALDIPTVPQLGYIRHIPTTRDELKIILPYSFTALFDVGDPSYEGEGIVAKPKLVLLNARGERVMWKLTFREWAEDTRR